MGFRFVKHSMIWNDLERSNAYAITDNQKVICWGRNVWIMLVLLTYYTVSQKSSHLYTLCNFVKLYCKNTVLLRSSLL